MLRCARIMVVGFCAVFGPGVVEAQEGGGVPVPPPTAPRYADWEAVGTQGAVTAGGRDATAAGIEILKRGGNAADAAAATILALSVTDSRSFCFGGEVPIMIYDARTKRVTVIAGQGVAPRLATREEFVRRGGIPLKGIEAAAVPAALDACLTLLDRFGTMTLTQVVTPTRRILGRPSRRELWHADFARTLETLVAAEAMADPVRGDPTAVDRSQGLRLVADAFYRGPIAHRIDAWSRANGGLIRYVDLATHTTRVEEPVAVTYRGRKVYKCGVWTQGPCLLQALQILEGFDLKAMGRDRPETIHTIVEAMKLAMADRDTYYADPLFVEVPLAELLSTEYASRRRALIDAKHASMERRPGDPRSSKAVLDPSADPAARRPAPPVAAVNDTTTCLVADRLGNVVAATPSGWSGVVAGDTGVWLGSRLQSFNTWEGHPDVIEPGKRPRITLSPTIVLDADEMPAMAVSVAGGDNQDQMILQLLVDSIDFGLTPSASVTVPRFMSDHFISSFGQKPPILGQLRINPELGQDKLDALKQMGHKLVVRSGPLSAAPCVINFFPTGGTRSQPQILAAGDPRAGRHAMAY
ncbi:MAG: gamma-glutamyltransferase family protein [Isosphaeraceae bacterium]